MILLFGSLLAPPEKPALGSNEDLPYVFHKYYTDIKRKLNHYCNIYEKYGAYIVELFTHHVYISE